MKRVVLTERAVVPGVGRAVLMSRYHMDFEELEMLGEGGFGAVWKCRNRLDGQLYAIKKIRLDPSNEFINKKLLREVKTLSGLHHQSVVRYFQAWIEGDKEGEANAMGSSRGDEDDDSGEEEDEEGGESDDSEMVEDSLFSAEFLGNMRIKKAAAARLPIPTATNPLYPGGFGPLEPESPADGNEEERIEDEEGTDSWLTWKESGKSALPAIGASSWSSSYSHTTNTNTNKSVTTSKSEESKGTIASGEGSTALPAGAAKEGGRQIGRAHV